MVDCRALLGGQRAISLFQQQFRSQWNLIMAGSVIGALPLIIVFFLFQKQFVQGISLAGSKG